MNPFDRLDRFEDRHGDYVTLLNDYVRERNKHDGGMPNGSRQALRLLTTHERLVSVCVGWSMKEEEERKARSMLTIIGLTKEDADTLTKHYRKAIRAWKENRQLREAAESLWFDMEEFCKRYVDKKFPKLDWHSVALGSDEAWWGVRAWPVAQYEEGVIDELPHWAKTKSNYEVESHGA